MIKRTVLTLGLFRVTRTGPIYAVETKPVKMAGNQDRDPWVVLAFIPSLQAATIRVKNLHAACTTEQLLG